MSDIWAFLLQTGAASLAAAMLLLVKRLFLDKLSPRWQYGIWALLGLRLLLPAGLGGRYVLLDWQLVLEWAKTGVESGLSSALAGPYTLTRVLAPVPIFPRGLPAPGSFTDLLFYVYAAGAAACLGWYLLSYLRLRLALNAGRPAGAARLDQIRRVCARYGLRPPRRVVEAQGLGSAFVCSPLRPVLALPAGVEVDDKVILHELLHLRYGDVWAGVLVCALRCLHWCNPLIWYCCDRAQNDCEALCDQRVLERLEGEARRDYGRILLSMADGRYARAPGTSSMANGGRNIKRRIGSIARFKRYPRGMALVSVCVAVVLCLGCVTGTARPDSAAMPAEGAPVSWIMAQARVRRATTPAGAIDTYAKALLTGSYGYLAMATPLFRHAGLATLVEASRHGKASQLSAPFEAYGPWEMSAGAYQADWRVFNLAPQADGSYFGRLIFVERGSERTALSQMIRVSRADGGWAVEPDAPLEPMETAGYGMLYPQEDYPSVTYTARVDGLHITFDFQLMLGVDNQVISDSIFSSTNYLDTSSKPGTPFTQLEYSVGGQIVETSTGHTVYASVDWYPMTARQLARGDLPGALRGTGFRGTVSLPAFAGRNSGGGVDARGVGMDAVPPAMALSFTYLGEPYTCIARLEGGAP